jgi:SAM-dependent methyltransferase
MYAGLFTISAQDLNLIRAFDQISKVYDQLFGNFITSWMRAYTRRFVPSLIKGSSKTLLEIGCGTGIDTVWFLKKGYNVISIDISSKMCELTRSRVIARFGRIPDGTFILPMSSQQIGKELPAILDDIPVDVCYSSMGALNTDPDLKSLLNHLISLMSKDGIMIASLMNRNAWWINLFQFLKKKRGIFRNSYAKVPLGSTQVICSLYTIKEIEFLFQQHFVIEAIKTFPCLLPPPFVTSLQQSTVFTFITKMEHWVEKTFLHRFGDHILIVAKPKIGF